MACLHDSSLFLLSAFSPGSVTLEDYSVSVSDIGGELPYEMVEHNRTVVLQYCCRNDGDQDNPVSLPDNYPFILLKVASRKHLRTKVTPDFDLTYSKMGEIYGVGIK